MLYWIELLGWNEMNSGVPPDEETEIKFDQWSMTMSLKSLVGWVSPDMARDEPKEHAGTTKNR